MIFSKGEFIRLARYRIYGASIGVIHIGANLNMADISSPTKYATPFNKTISPKVNAVKIRISVMQSLTSRLVFFSGTFAFTLPSVLI